MRAPLPENESARLEALRRYNILDSLPDQDFDHFTKLASYICETPIALITLIDQDRQWFKSTVGTAVTETPRDIAICAHAILEPQEVMVVNDLQADRRFEDNPFVANDPHLRFYAGAPLVTSDGLALGTLCVFDNQPRQLTEDQIGALRKLSHLAISQLELRRYQQQQADALVESEAFSRAVLNSLTAEIAVLDTQGTIISVNEAWQHFAYENGADPETRVAIGTNYLAVSEKAARFGNDGIAAATVKGIRAVLDGSLPAFSLEYPCDTPTAPLWFVMTVLPLVGQTGGAVVSHEDITKRKQAQQLLLSSETHLRNLVNAAPFGAFIYDLMPDGRLILTGANKWADAILGADNSLLIGKTFEEAFPALINTELPILFHQVAEHGLNINVDQFAYAQDSVVGSYEIRAVQIAPNRIAAFFRSITELAQAYDETIEGWSRAMDFRDKETEGHSQRVTEMTLRLAKAMGFKDSELLHIRRGALLHDMGKLGVPDHVLLKPGQLTNDEWVMMRKHPQLAYEMLAPINFLHPALDIPLCHHEKWDGTGYPRGLKGDQIPLAARIFAVADVWDALRSDRAYRKGWSEAKVRDHIQHEAGTHFDPQVVEIFLKMVSE